MLSSQLLPPMIIFKGTFSGTLMKKWSLVDGLIKMIFIISNLYEKSKEVKLLVRLLVEFLTGVRTHGYTRSVNTVSCVLSNQIMD